MKDTYVNAKLIDKDVIRVCIFSTMPLDKLEPSLQVDGVIKMKLTPTRTNSFTSITVADFRLHDRIELGHSYFLLFPQYGPVALDVTEATTFEGFDEEFYYEDWLGCLYKPKCTEFALWAPLASNVILKYKDPGDNNFAFVPMVRGDRGVFHIMVQGNHEGAIYRFLIRNSEITVESTDPYAKASTLNGEFSVVADFSKLETDFRPECLPVLNNPTDVIIYEAHVRDMTISSYTDIKHKGQFLGMIEKGRKTKKGQPAGFDYLKSLGFTHLQLLPLYDYKTVDESNPSSGYNWGYDPAQYFVPEGSYASDLKDPLSRIKDLKLMVKTFHEAGIRIVMDVVFNHVYEYQSSVFEKIVPNYFFRRRHNGQMANTSGCGDDLASERPMVRKLIVDASMWWIEQYGIDGFRFDLMGIIDVDTLNEIAAKARAIKPTFMLYGEGWNMGGEVNVQLGHMGNYQLLPQYGFFNDVFRENVKRYMVEDFNSMNGFKYVFASSCLDFLGQPKFLSANQTINYVECHDNSTFFDFVSNRRQDLSAEDHIRLCKLALASCLFSFGIPFIHMGQELGQSKWGEDNTYNKGDDFNKFSYRLLEERADMVEYARTLIHLRKSMRFFHIYDPRVIDTSIHIDQVGEATKVYFRDHNLIAPYKEVEVFFNPSGFAYTYSVEKPRLIYCSQDNFSKSKNSDIIDIPPRSFVLTYALNN